MNYQEFIEQKTQLGGNAGFKPLWMPDFLFDFQKSLVEWSVLKGRAAIFADCGLGKTPMQLVWAENVVRKTNKPVLILTPLAVSAQTVREAEKFKIDCTNSRDGKRKSLITVTNYQRLHYFDWKDFGGVVCDESSILKSFDGSTRQAVTEFMRRIPYRLLCTATAAPNDYIELGTSSEALGELRRVEMLSMFFTHDGGETAKWRVKGHAQRRFWQWVCTWARAVRTPSDIGFPDNGFVLPPLEVNEHIVRSETPDAEYLFSLPALTLDEQRKERRHTLKERCEMAATLTANTGKPAVVWCHLNCEGDLLKRLIPGAVEVSGSDPDEYKEEMFEAFARGDIRVLVSKPVIAGFGLNWQHCAHQTFFPSHSFEQWYQAIRRCWRFGQKSRVKIDVISSEGEAGVTANLNRKAIAADGMFKQMVSLINHEVALSKQKTKTKPTKIPAWL